MGLTGLAGNGSVVPSAHGSTHQPGGTDDLYEGFGQNAPTRAENGNRLLWGLSQGNFTMVSGTLYLGFFTTKESFTASFLTTMIGTLAVAGTETLHQMGLYTASSTGSPAFKYGTTSIALACATSPSGTTLFTAGAPAGAIAVGADNSTALSTYPMVAGQRYAIGLLWVGSGGTVPQMRTVQPIGGIVQLAPMLMATGGTGLSAMPTSVAAGANLVANNAVPYVAASQFNV